MKKLSLIFLFTISAVAATVKPAGMLYDTNSLSVLQHGLDYVVRNVTGNYAEINTNMISPRGASVLIQMEDRLNNEINAWDDNVKETDADIATNLQKSQQRAGGTKVVYLPAGTYTLSGLMLTNNFVLRGDANGGTIIKHKLDATTSMFYTDGTTKVYTIRFENVTLDGQQKERQLDDSTRGNMDHRLGSLILGASQWQTVVCRDVTFKNHLRTAIMHFGSLDVDYCTFLGGAQHNLIQTPYAGFSTYISGYAGVPSSIVDTNKLTITVNNSFFRTDSIAPEDLGKNPGGIIFSEQEVVGHPGNVFDRCVFEGNKFLGVGVTENANHISAIDSYNGSRAIVVHANHVYYFSLGAFAFGRCDDVVCSDNIIAYGQELAEGGTTPAIQWQPVVREGSYPFTVANNNRTNEVHYRFVCSGNIITNVQSVGIQINGDHFFVHNNFVSDIRPSHGINTPPTTSVGAGVLIGIGGNGSIGTISDNMLWNVPYNTIYFSPALRDLNDIDILNNRCYYDINVARTNFSGAGQLIRLVGSGGYRIKNSRIEGNYISGIPTQSMVWTNIDTGICIYDNDNVSIKNNNVQHTLNGYGMFSSNTNVSFAFNQSLSENIGLVVNSTSSDIRAAFNKLTAPAPTSINAGATLYDSFKNSWDLSLYGQDYVSVRPETDSTNNFNVKNKLNNQIILGVNSVDKYIFGLTSAMFNYRAVTDGSSASPAYSFFNDTDTGFYRNGSGQVAFAGDSVYTLNFSPLGIRYNISGSASNPVFGWVADNDGTSTGFYRSAADELAISNNGTQSAKFDATGKLTLNSLTASKLVGTDASKILTSITIGSGLDLTSGVLSSTASGAGEANTGANLGIGVPTYESKSGVSLRFNTFTNGNGISLTSNANTFTYSANLAQGKYINLTTNVDKSITISVGPNYTISQASGMWKFDESSGNALDSSGNGNDLTEHGTVAQTDSGKIGGARYFSETAGTDWFSYPSSGWNTIGAEDFTITGWISTSGATSFSGIGDDAFIGKWDYNNKASWMMELDHGSYTYNYALAFYWSPDGTTLNELCHYELPFDITGVDWVFVTARRYNNTFTITATPDTDTSVVAGTTTAFSGTFFDNSDVPFTIGTLLNTGASESTTDSAVMVDEFGLWNGALSDKSIKDLFNAGAARSMGFKANGFASNWEAVSGSDSHLPGTATIDGDLTVSGTLSSGSTGIAGYLRLTNAAGTHFMGYKSSETATTDFTLTPPDAGFTGMVQLTGSNPYTISLATNGIQYTSPTGTENLGNKTITNSSLAASVVTVNDDAYNATSWNGSTNVPTKNAVRDKLEALDAAALTSGTVATARLGSGTASSSTILFGDQTYKNISIVQQTLTNYFEFALSDETTAITTGTKVTWRAPFAFTIKDVRASVTTASSSGIPAIDIKEAGTTIFSTTLTIDASEKTSTTAATAYVLSDSSIADDAEITFIVNTAGTSTAGLKVKVYYVKP